MTLNHKVEASLVWMSCELMEMIKVDSFDAPLDIWGTSKYGLLFINSKANSKPVSSSSEMSSRDYHQRLLFKKSQ